MSRAPFRVDHGGVQRWRQPLVRNGIREPAAAELPPVRSCATARSLRWSTLRRVPTSGFWPAQPVWGRPLNPTILPLYTTIT